MKVMQINATYGYGSTGTIVRDIDLVLKKEGVESIIVYASTNPKPEDGYKVGNKIDEKLHAFFTRIYGATAYGSSLETRKLIRFIIREKPDVIHLHNLHSNCINLKLLLRYISKNSIPTILTLHDCWFFTGKCYHFITSNCDRWKSGCGNCPRNKMDIPSLFFDRTAQTFKDKCKLFQSIPNLTIVGCSKWITELAMQSPIFINKKFEQIYNGVDISIFRYRSDDERNELKKKMGINGEFVILGMANKWLIPENNDAMVAIMSIPNIKIVIVGCNEMQVSKLKAIDRVIPIGYIDSREELSSLYAMADVFVNLTLVDTLPTVNMEALCCGTPVITYDVAGSPELIEKGEGYIVKVLDKDQLVFSINEIIGSNILRMEISNNAAQRYDKNRQYHNYVALYRNITGK